MASFNVFATRFHVRGAPFSTPALQALPIAAIFSATTCRRQGAESSPKCQIHAVSNSASARLYVGAAPLHVLRVGFDDIPSAEIVRPMLTRRSAAAAIMAYFVVFISILPARLISTHVHFYIRFLARISLMTTPIAWMTLLLQVRLAILDYIVLGELFLSVVLRA